MVFIFSSDYLRETNNTQTNNVTPEIHVANQVGLGGALVAQDVPPEIEKTVKDIEGGIVVGGQLTPDVHVEDDIAKVASTLVEANIGGQSPSKPKKVRQPNPWVEFSKSLKLGETGTYKGTDYKRVKTGAAGVKRISES